MSLIPEEVMREYLCALCEEHGINYKPKAFQVEFFRRAISGVSGFLRAQCGSGKSFLFQLLPFVLQHFRFQDISFAVVLVVMPLKAISEAQILDQRVPSCMLTEGGAFIMADSDKKLHQFSSVEMKKLYQFVGVIYSSPEVWDGKDGMRFKLYFSGRIVALVIDEADKISQWGLNFREGYTRLGLLRPFMAENSAVYFLTATATAEDMKIACELLAVQDDLQMNICVYRGEYIKSINRPNSGFGWEGVFKNRGQIVYEPGLRQLLHEEYLEEFFADPNIFPRTVILFRDQSQLGHTADIIRQKLGYESPASSSWIQFHSLVDSLTLQEIFKRFANPANCFRLILMTTKGLCGTHIVDVERTVMVRPMSSPHDLIQLMGRGGRGPNVLESSLEIIWNNSDLSCNVPGMTSDVRRILDSECCIPENLCKIFGYEFVKNSHRCCSNCDLKKV